jgi:hypothetical protein
MAEISFGNHQLLIVAGSTVDEEDDNNNVTIRAYNPRTKNNKKCKRLF